VWHCEADCGQLLVEWCDDCSELVMHPGVVNVAIIIHLVCVCSPRPASLSRGVLRDAEQTNT
jgi:hypothetical protein